MPSLGETQVDSRSARVSGRFESSKYESSNADIAPGRRRRGSGTAGPASAPKVLGDCFRISASPSLTPRLAPIEFASFSTQTALFLTLTDIHTSVFIRGAMWLAKRFTFLLTAVGMRIALLFALSFRGKQRHHLV